MVVFWVVKLQELFYNLLIFPNHLYSESIMFFKEKTVNWIKFLSYSQLFKFQISTGVFHTIFISVYIHNNTLSLNLVTDWPHFFLKCNRVVKRNGYRDKFACILKYKPLSHRGKAFVNIQLAYIFSLPHFLFVK